MNLNVPDHKKFKNPILKVTKTYLDEQNRVEGDFLEDQKCLDEGFISLSPIKLETISNANLKGLTDFLDEF